MRDVFRSRPWIGRATAVASATVLLAAGGVAYASSTAGTSRNGPPSRQVHGPFASSKGAPFVAGAAVVNSNGSLARGVGVTSSSEVGPAEYQVLFNRNVSRCAYEATLGSPGTGSAPDGQIGVASRHAHKNGVWIVTYSSSGSFAPQSFHLVVIC